MPDRSQDCGQSAAVADRAGPGLLEWQIVDGSRIDLTRTQILGFRLWRPRFHVFAVAARDLAVFTLGTLPDDAKGRRRAEDLAARLHAYLDGARMAYRQAARARRAWSSRAATCTSTGRPRTTRSRGGRIIATPPTDRRS